MIQFGPVTRVNAPSVSCLAPFYRHQRVTNSKPAWFSRVCGVVSFLIKIPYFQACEAQIGKHSFGAYRAVFPSFTHGRIKHDAHSRHALTTLQTQQVL
jgi:hypothetical protein